MAWNNSNADQPQSNAEFYIFNTILKLRDSEAEGNIDKTWVYMRHSLQMLMAYLRAEEKAILDQGIRELMTKIAEAEHDHKGNDAALNAVKRPLIKKFIEQNMYYVYMALPRARMIKVDKEGELPMDKLEIDTIAKIVRTPHSVDKKLTEIEEKEKKKEVKTDGQ